MKLRAIHLVKSMRIPRRGRICLTEMGSILDLHGRQAILEIA